MTIKLIAAWRINCVKGKKVFWDQITLDLRAENHLPANILEVDKLIVVQIVHDLFHNNLYILQEVKPELVQTHHVGGDGMKFPLLVSLSSYDTVFPYQISERLWVARLEQFAFILHNEFIECRISRYNRPLSKQTA